MAERQDSTRPARTAKTSESSWIPDSGLIREHYDYGIYCTDAPPVYHVASILAVLSTSVADRAVLEIDGATHPLHIWTMLVGRSSVDRKTTAARLAVDHLRGIAAERLLSIAGSPEGFLEALEEEPTSLLFVPEGAALFEQREATYWRHARGLLMDLYDAPADFRRRLARKREIEILDPHLSVLVACAEALLRHHATFTDWLGGFLPRFLIIGGDSQPYRPRLRGDVEAASRTREKLQRLMDRQWGVIRCEAPAARVLEDFAAEIHSSLGAYPDGLHPAIVRLSETAHRAAALYAIAAADPETSAEVQIDSDSARHACALCRHSLNVALSSLGDHAASPGTHRDILRMENLIRDAGVAGILRSRLLKQSGLTADQLDKIVYTLLESETIELRRGANVTGRPGQIYVHVEARKDAVRPPQKLTIDTEVRAWICVTGEEEHILDGLPPLSEEDEDAVDWYAGGDDDTTLWS